MKFHSTIALVAWAFAVHAHAQPQAPEIDYQSVFEGYRAYSEPELKNWPKANELVDEIGGWRVYAREPYVNKAVEINKTETPPAIPPVQPWSMQ